jgi:hypothetical protein
LKEGEFADEVELIGTSFPKRNGTANTETDCVSEEPKKLRQCGQA